MHMHRVLVVDDDEDIRESLMDFLQDHGFETMGAADGRDALDKLGDGAALPCVIILDLMMPVMDGRAFREQQLRDPALSGIPVVVVSAYPSIPGSAGDMDVVDRLSKPLNLPVLLRTVQARCKEAPEPVS